MKPIVEHVWSGVKHSQIFNDLFSRFEQYQTKFHHVSQFRHSVPRVHARIYHRPQLEKRLQTPCACIVHHDLRDQTADHQSAHALEMYKQSNLVICINQRQSEYLISRGVQKTTVIHHGYDPELFSIKPSAPSSNRKFRIGIISRRYSSFVKGEPFIFELAARLSPDLISFVLAGRDRDKDVPYLRSLGYEAEHREVRNYEEIMQVYADIDGLMIASVSEGGPASFPEGWMLGLPLIVRPVGMIPDFVNEDNNCLTLTDDSDLDAHRIHSFIKAQSASPMSAVARKPMRNWAQTISSYEIALAEALGLTS